MYKLIMGSHIKREKEVRTISRDKMEISKMGNSNRQEFDDVKKKKSFTFTTARVQLIIVIVILVQSMISV